MTILTHGSDLSLAPGVEPLVRISGGSVRSAVERLSRLGFSAVQLDATLSGLRPRELGRRARQDLLALLRRLGPRPGGLDLFIPRTHFLDPQHVDRAMAATTAGIELAADLGRLPLSIVLPVKDIAEDARSALVQSADDHGIRLGIHAEDHVDALLSWIQEVDLPALGAAIDPAAVLGRAEDPVRVCHRLGPRLVAARLCDFADGLRCHVGDGELDVMQYRIALDLAAGQRAGPIVLDLRGLKDPDQAARVAAKAWDDAGFKA